MVYFSAIHVVQDCLAILFLRNDQRRQSNSWWLTTIARSRRLLGTNINRCGVHDCAEAESGEEALAFVRKQPPRLLLLDYDMPGSMAPMSPKQIRADPSPAVAQIPTIMLTGHGSEESEVLCLEAGADDFVTKPIHPEVLRARIETQLRLRSMREQLLKQNEELEAWRGNLEQDLEAAQRTQRSLIPAKPPGFRDGKSPHFIVPVIQVGGDIYGWLRMRDGRMLFGSLMPPGTARRPRC